MVLALRMWQHYLFGNSHLYIPQELEIYLYLTGFEYEVEKMT
jgi:hypothetical protein